MSVLDDFSERRTQLHDGCSTSRALGEHFDKVGLAGEFAFGAFCGICPDLSDRPAGDNGIDFTVPLRFSVDVKTFRKPYNLIHEAGKPVADIYVLARYVDSTSSAELLGWEFGKKLAKAPKKDFGKGVVNHYIPADQLRPMSDLQHKLMQLR